MSGTANPGGVFERLVLRLTRLWPLHRGRGRLALSGLLRTAGETGSVRTVLRTGECLYVVRDDYIGRMVRFFGDLDPAVSAVVRRLLRRDDVVIDVGANVGIVTLQAAGIVGNGGHVFAFEPIGLLSGLLERSVTLNGFENVTVLRVALSDRAGRGSMSVHATALGSSSLRDDTAGESCAVSTLDEVDLRGFQHPRLLKIDVEGHESKVLAGGRRFLRESAPDHVLFESHVSRGAFWDRREVRILGEHGYRFRAILRGAFGRSSLRDVPPGGQGAERTYDFLATRAGVEG